MDGIPDFIEQKDSEGLKYWTHKDHPDVAFTSRGRALTIQYNGEWTSFYIPGLFDFSEFFPFMKAFVDFVDLFDTTKTQKQCPICGKEFCVTDSSVPFAHFKKVHWESLPATKAATKS